MWYNIYVSGSRLRRSFKHRDHSLTHLYISDVALTDGSWKTIAQGLLELPLLSRLHLSGSLCQEHAASRSRSTPERSQPKQPDTDDVLDVDKARNYLEFLIKLFSTSLFEEEVVVYAWALPHPHRVNFYDACNP
jgi:hypothetical protein